MTEPTNPSTALEQVLELRVQAAKAWLVTCADAALAAPIAYASLAQQSQMVGQCTPEMREKILAALEAVNDAPGAQRAAEKALDLAERDLKALRGEGQPIPFRAAGTKEIERYAVELLREAQRAGADLHADDALTWAQADERLRSNRYGNRYVTP